MAKKPRTFVLDPGYQDPGNGQPLYPTIGDYPSRTRFGTSGPAGKFAPVVGKGAKAAKPKKGRVAKPAKAATPRTGVAKPKSVKPAAAGHLATRTRPGGSSRASGKGAAIGLDFSNYQIVDVQTQGGYHYQEVIIAHASGVGFGMGGPALTGPGHHPQATGYGRVGVGTGHVGVPRRAVIFSYNAGSGLALVRDADAPDAPPYSVAVSPAVAGSMSGAAIAGLSLWDTGDPDDLFISTVF